MRNGSIASITLIFVLVLMRTGPIDASVTEPTVGPPMSLTDVLKKAQDFNPSLRAARFSAEASNENISVQRSAYLPEISAAAIASTGNIGSFSIFDVDSDIGTSQRVGAGAGLVLKQNIWDFGRTGSAVQTAKDQHTMEINQNAVVRADIAQGILRTYLNCAYLHSQLESARFAVDQTSVLAKETDKFVRSGQRSVVERYLVDAEAKEAETRVAEFTSRVTDTERRLAIEIGQSVGGKVRCTNLAMVKESIESIEGHIGISPLVELQQAKVQVAQSRLERAKAENRPVIYGMATGGYFSNDRLNEQTNYAAGVGIKLPLFEGFRTESQIRLQSAQLNAEQARVAASQLGLDRANSQYEEQTRALAIRIAFLERERKLADEVFALARKRYFALQGTMVDLRDAIRNMNRILQATDEAYRDLYMTRGERSFLNGAHFD